MSQLGQQIEKDLQELPFEEQLELLTRLIARVKKLGNRSPRRPSFSSEAELVEKAVEGLNSPSSPMTESDWDDLDSRIARIASSKV